MLRQDLTPSNPPNSTTDRQHSSAEQPARFSEAVSRLDIQQSLNVLEELILESPRVPFSRRTLVDEDQLLEQLDRIRLNLPTVFQEAIQIVQQRDRILHEANQYAQDMIAAAEQEAARRLNDLGIVQQADAKARQVKQQLEQECDAMRSQTQAEIEQWQEAALQYWEQTKQQTEADCQTLRNDADTYANDVLQRIEYQLSEMMRVIQNGRRALPTAGPTVEADSHASDAPTPAHARGTALPPSTTTRQGKQRRRSST